MTNSRGKAENLSKTKL